MTFVRGRPVLTCQQQRTNIKNAFPNINFCFVFSEEDSANVATSQSLTLTLLLNQLKSGDKIYVYSWTCLIRQQDTMSFDVCEFIHKIVKGLGVNIIFVADKIDTSYSRDRYHLGNIVINAQYAKDEEQESSNCCGGDAIANNNNAKPVQAASPPK